jgi:hypothetical protein
MNNTIYPSSKRDRFMFGLAVLNSLIACLILVADRSLWGSGRFLLWGNVGVAVFNFASTYFLRDKPKPTGDRYSQMIRSLSSVGSTLSDVKAFLMDERKVVLQTQETVSKLQTQRQTLEPIVKAQRETVEAILSAHSRTLRTDAWKDRLIGFSLGVVSSLVAAYIYAILSNY